MQLDQIYDNIDVLKRGDSIYVYDKEKKKAFKKKVFKSLKSNVKDFVVVNESKVLPSTTKAYVENKDAFLECGKALFEGDSLLTQSLQIEKVTSIKKVTLESSIEVLHPIVKGGNLIFFSGYLILGRKDSAIKKIPSGCIAEGSEITLPDLSTKKVEELEVGQQVLTYNRFIKVKESKRVLGLDSVMHRGCCKVEHSKGSLIVTKDHPVYVKQPGRGIGWASICPYTTKINYPYLKCIRKLSRGDFLKTDSEWSVVRNIEECLEETRTYNLWSVEDNRNYYANGVLVHNKGSVISGTSLATSPKGGSPVEDIKIGEKVLSYSESQGKICEENIRGLSSTKVSPYYVVKTSSGKSIGISSQQLIFCRQSPGKEFWAAIDKDNASRHYSYIDEVITLEKNLEVYTQDRSWELISEIECVEEESDAFVVCNVERTLTFFANGFLCHNFSSIEPKASHLILDTEVCPVLSGTYIKTEDCPFGKDVIDVKEGDTVFTVSTDNDSLLYNKREVSDIKRRYFPNYYKVCIKSSEGEEHTINALPHQPFLRKMGEVKDWVSIDPGKTSKLFPHIKSPNLLCKGDFINVSLEDFFEVSSVYLASGDIQCIEIWHENLF